MAIRQKWCRRWVCDVTRTRSRKEIWHYTFYRIEWTRPSSCRVARESGCLLASSSGSDICALEFSTETILSLCLHYVLLVTASRQTFFFFLSSGSLVCFFSPHLFPLLKNNQCVAIGPHCRRQQIYYVYKWYFSLYSLYHWNGWNEREREREKNVRNASSASEPLKTSGQVENGYHIIRVVVELIPKVQSEYTISRRWWNENIKWVQSLAQRPKSRNTQTRAHARSKRGKKILENKNKNRNIAQAFQWSMLFARTTGWPLVCVLSIESKSNCTSSNASNRNSNTQAAREMRRKKLERKKQT